MIASTSTLDLPDDQRIVITGVGLTAPNGNDLATFRESLLAGRSGVQPYEIRYVGETLAGICDFDVRRYQSAQGCSPRHAGRFGGHLRGQRGGRRQRAWIGRTRSSRGSASIWA